MPATLDPNTPAHNNLAAPVISDGEKCYLAIYLPSLVKLCEKPSFLSVAETNVATFRSITKTIFEAKPLIRKLADFEQTEGASLQDKDWQSIQLNAIRLNLGYIQIRADFPEPEVEQTIERAEKEATGKIRYQLKEKLTKQTKAGRADFQLNRTIQSNDRVAMSHKYADMERPKKIRDFLDSPEEDFLPHMRQLIIEAKAKVRELRDQKNEAADKRIDRICGSGIVVHLLSKAFKTLQLGSERREMINNALCLLGDCVYRYGDTCTGVPKTNTDLGRSE